MTDPLASAADFATLTGRVDTDAQLVLALRLASGIIRTYTRQTITAATSTAARLHGGRPTLILPERPVTAVTTITVLRYGNTYLPVGDAPYGIVPANFYTWDGLDRIDLSLGGVWPELLEVNYTHGYTEVPDDIADVCLSLALRKLGNPEALRSEAIGGYSYTAAVTSGELTELEQKILNDYRRRAGG